MKLLSVVAAFAAMPLLATAQNVDYNVTTSWTETPAKHTVSSEFKSASAVGILDERNIEYRLEGKDIIQYITYHRIYHVNDDKGIEMYNKIYLPVSSSGVLLDIKARTVLASGKVITLPKEKIKQIEEEGRLYHLFAMEGVEKGSDVEYIYTVKRMPTYFGMEVFQTGSIPYEKIRFTLTVPSHLKFDAKGFNGFAISKDSLINEKRIMVGADSKVKEIDEEKYAVRDPHLKRVEYKLSYNLSTNSNVRMYTWKDFAKRAFDIYTTTTPKDEKPLNNYLSQIKLDNATTPEAKIVAIEDHIKSTINIDKNLIGEDVDLVEKILKSKSATTSGIVKLFAALFEKSGINYQLVFLGRRDEFPIDEDIENWNRMDETIFYFPSGGKYLSPSSVELRYPFIPAYWAGTKGLFLKGTTIGSFKTAIGSFAEVKMEPYSSHAFDMDIVVKLNPALDTVLIHAKQIFTGYSAAAYRPVYTFLPKDKQEEVNMEIVKSISKGTIENIKVENTKLTDFADNKPYTIAADIKSTEMLEQAGNKLLLKIGEAIGPQAEMYQEKPRQLPVELDFPHALNRKIVFEVPAGYMVKNLSDLNMNVSYKDGDEITMSFVSKYRQEGNNIVVDVAETYNRLRYPLSEFENFKKVINAAADFNKKVLVLEKK